MSIRELPVVAYNATLIIGEMLSAMVGRQVTFPRALTFCTQLRRRGIVSLLLQGDADDLAEQLSFSGRAFLHVLPSFPEAVKATSDQTPFFDALAGGDVSCAAAIGAASRQSWNPQEELEEDFLYFFSLMTLLRGDEPRALTPALDRWQALADETGDDDLRLAVCRALVSRDPDELDAALEALMKQNRRHYRTLLDKNVILEEEAATEGAVSVEGLALIRIAGVVGMRTRSDYPMVPSLARRAAWKPGADDAWMRDS